MAFENCTLVETQGNQTATHHFEKTLVSVAPAGSGGGDGVPFFQTTAGKVVLALLVVAPAAGAAAVAASRFLGRTRGDPGVLDGLTDDLLDEKERTRPVTGPR
ncbi:MAG: hypothetical protein ACTSU5_08170 [Promethearchaeota archaeon]